MALFSVVSTANGAGLDDYVDIAPSIKENMQKFVEKSKKEGQVPYVEHNIFNGKTLLDNTDKKFKEELKNAPQQAIDKIIAKPLAEIVKEQSQRGPTTVCLNGHRWICFKNKYHDAEKKFATVIYGLCHKPSNEETCFQAY